MATHELPDWEGPSTAPKHTVFHNPISITPIDKAKAFFSRGRDRTSFQAFDKETAVETPPATTRAPSNRKYCGLGLRIWLIIAIVSVLLLALIIGLAVGLTRKSSYVQVQFCHPSVQSANFIPGSSKAQDLPLPTNAGIFTGDLTYYSPGPGYGACGYQNTSTEAICAVSHIIWDAALTGSNPNANPLCGKRIRITRFDESVGGNRSVDVEVVDRCVGCKANDLDLSLAMFTSLADESLGRVLGSWAVSWVLSSIGDCMLTCCSG